MHWINPEPQGYIRGKFLDKPVFDAGDGMMVGAGTAFRRNPENPAVLDALTFTVREPGCVTPEKPSAVFGK